MSRRKITITITTDDDSNLDAIRGLLVIVKWLTVGYGKGDTCSDQSTIEMSTRKIPTKK